MERRAYSETERRAAVEGFQRWEGSQTSYAESVGIPQTTLSRWINGDTRPHRRSEAAQGDEPVTLLEVVRPAAISPAETVEAAVRVGLGGGVELRLDVLPPARWVAELAAELRRC